MKLRQRRAAGFASEWRPAWQEAHRAVVSPTVAPCGCAPAVHGAPPRMAKHRRGWEAGLPIAVLLRNLPTRHAPQPHLCPAPMACAFFLASSIKPSSLPSHLGEAWRGAKGRSRVGSPPHSA